MTRYVKAPRRPLATDLEVAEFLGVTVNHLRKARCTKTGPLANLTFYRVGRAIRYDWQDVDRWLSARIEDAA